MALDGDRLGIAIAAAITASKPAPGAKITASELETMWKLVGNEIVDEIKNFGEVGNLPAGSYLDSTTAPVTGTSGTLLGAIS